MYMLRTTAKAFAKDVFINQGTKVRGSTTIRYIVLLTINYAAA